MNVILLDKIENLGNLGDKVTVRAGYARNFLIPGGKAKYATVQNIAEFEVRNRIDIGDELSCYFGVFGGEVHAEMGSGYSVPLDPESFVVFCRAPGDFVDLLETFPRRGANMNWGHLERLG